MIPDLLVLGRALTDADSRAVTIKATFKVLENWGKTLANPPVASELETCHLGVLAEGIIAGCLELAAEKQGGCCCSSSMPWCSEPELAELTSRTWKESMAFIHRFDAKVPGHRKNGLSIPNSCYQKWNKRHPFSRSIDVQLRLLRCGLSAASVSPIEAEK
jgi:hypothetical protein